MTINRRRVEATLLILGGIAVLGGYWLTHLPQSLDPPPGFAVYAGVLIAIYTATHLLVRRLAPAADHLLLPIAMLLNGLGLIMIQRIDLSTSGDFSGAQLRWLTVSVVAFAATLWFVRDVRLLSRYRFTAAFIGVALLLLPLVPGLGRVVNSAKLWIQVGPLNFQPGELAKIVLVVFFAGYLSERRELLAVAKARARHFGPVALAWAVSMVIMVLERDLGSSLLFFTIFAVMLWMATGRSVYLVSGAALFAAGAVGAYRLFDHVQTRITIWLNAFDFPQTTGYQLVQSLFAMATGGVWGTGLGLGRPDFIPNVRTDFIFPALGEELGLAGTAAVLVAYALFTARGFAIATRCKDDFSKLLAAGLALAFGFQTFVILGGVTRLIPLTGITLPFMSYGGSSLLSNFILVALLMRISHDSNTSEVVAPRTEVNLAAGGGR